MKASGQLSRGTLRFATFDARGSLQMVLGVKGKWKERKDGRKDCPGQPETAYIEEIHNVTQIVTVKEI
jgi:hypothetical protein